jgi:hypothetical protein
MPSKLLIIAAPVAFALLASVAFGAESEDTQGEGPGLGIPPQVGAHTTCLLGFGTIECRYIPLAPDPEDCPPGESLIKMRGFGHLSHVCVSSK